MGERMFCEGQYIQLYTLLLEKEFLSVKFMLDI